ncbi:hypothetical protein [Candidatus Poriferisocius sp.]|uniref:phage adaptor protein n=1 Tax=Candidatus Poriferisocius sp. TaxID=3101276 RepID=UPI003B516BA3
MIARYGDLLAELSTWLLENGIPVQPKTIIQLAEEDLRLDPRLVDLYTGDITLDSASITLPVGVQEIMSWTIGAPYGIVLRVEPAAKAARTSDEQGLPRLYHIVQDTAYLRPAPDQVYTSRMTYRASLPRLMQPTDDEPNADKNEYIEQFAGLYWYACLEQAYTYGSKPELASYFEQKKEQMILRVKSYQERKRMGGPPSFSFRMGDSRYGF